MDLPRPLAWLYRVEAAFLCCCCWFLFWNVACLVSGLESLQAAKAGHCILIVIVLRDQLWLAHSMPGLSEGLI